MNRVKCFILTGFLLFCSGFGFSATLWEQKGLTVRLVQTMPRNTVYTVEDAEKAVFKITLEKEMTEQEINDILNLKKQFYNFMFIQIEMLDFTVSKNGIYVVLVPFDIVYKDQNLMNYLPGGITFLFADNALSYHFPILKDRQLIKVKGVWEGEELLLNDILGFSEIKTLSPEVIQKDQKEAQPLYELIEQEKKKEERRNQEVQKKEREQKQDKEKEEKTYLPALNPQKDLLDAQKENKFIVARKLRAAFGTGSLFSLSYPSLLYWKLELFPSIGIIYDKKEGLNDLKTAPEDKKIMALPFYLRLNAHFWNTDSLGLYGFTGGLYSLGIQEYHSRLIGFAGIGQVFLQFFFAEVAWMVQKGASGLVIGFGFQLKL